MSNFKTFCFLAAVLVWGGFVGCTKQNPRTITKIDHDAAIPSGLPWQPQNGRVITLWVDPKDETMSTLYGNDEAVDAARSSGDRPAYTAGAMIALVTWKPREDERWFGANIPATVKSVEFVTVKSGTMNKSEYVYQRFEGGFLRQTLSADVLTPGGRTTYLLSQRAATMP
jgi:hypothetical protein